MAKRKREAKTIRITNQVKSRSASSAGNARSSRRLGLRRIRHVVVRPDTPAVRGMVAKVPHLGRVVEERS
jgi:large subunit ribosomal protein L30